MKDNKPPVAPYTFIRTPGLAESEKRLGKTLQRAPEPLTVCLRLPLQKDVRLATAALEAAFRHSQPEHWKREYHAESESTYLSLPKSWWLRWQTNLQGAGWLLYDERIIQ